MELFSRGENNLSTRRKTPKSNQKGRWSSLVVVKTIHLREGKLRSQTKRADGALQSWRRQSIYEKENSEVKLKGQMELFSRGEDNLSTRRKTPKSNQKGRWSSLIVVNTIHLREGKLRSQTKRADGALQSWRRQSIYEKENSEVKPKGQMELFSRGEDNPSTRRKTLKSNNLETSVKN